MVGLGPAEAESRWDLRESCGEDCAVTLVFSEYLWPDRTKNTVPPWGLVYPAGQESVVDAPQSVPGVPGII